MWILVDLPTTDLEIGCTQVQRAPRVTVIITTTKTSLENERLGNGDRFAIIVSSLHPLLLTEHAAKDLLLCGHVVVETLNLEISRFHLADYVKELY